MSKKPSLDVVLPVYNEEVDLAKNVNILSHFLKANLADFSWQIVIADNASTDRTPKIGRKLAKEHPDVSFLRLEKKGRGRALKKAWRESKADILSYMDLDLSTKLDYFPPLVRSLNQGYDIAIGSRLSPGSKVHGRTLTREITSRGYNILIKIFFLTRFSDAQCGFKALTKEAAGVLLPKIADNKFFLDTELLVLAEKSGMRIRNLPVEWTDDPTSTVNVPKTAWEDIKGLIRLRRTQPWKQIKWPKK